MTCCRTASPIPPIPSQVVTRFAVLPILSDNENKVLHLGVNLRFGKPVDNKPRLRSRPESFLAPYFVDIGSFPSDATRIFDTTAITAQSAGSRE